MKPLRIAVVAGEASGDALGAGLILAIKQHYPEVIIEGIGGEKLMAAGCQSLFPLERLSVMGFTEPLKRLPELMSIRKKLLKHFISVKPDIFIGIDAPAFNLGLAIRLKAAGIKTVHYVSPSVWAWRPGRIKKIKQGVDLMLTLFPFEADFYKQHDMPHVFVGHPLADNIPRTTEPEAAKRILGLNPKGRFIALLPGSRMSELTHLADVFFKAAKLCYQAEPGYVFIVPCLCEAHKDYLQSRLSLLAKEVPVHCVVGHAREAMSASDVVLVASGTASLEAMCLKRPMVVAYRMSAVTYRIAKWLVKTPFIALPNILAGGLLVPEYIQAEVTAETLSDALLDYIHHPDKMDKLKRRFDIMHESLAKNADQLACNAVLSCLGLPR